MVLDEICNEETYNKVYENGKFVRDSIKNANLSQVVDVRGFGLMIGIEIKGSSADIKKKAQEKGFLFLTAGPNVIRLLPPIVITREELTATVNVLKELLK